MKLYTYEDIAEIMNVSVRTVRNWKYLGVFKILGYRRIGRGTKREAVVLETEVKNLLAQKIIPPRGRK